MDNICVGRGVVCVFVNLYCFIKCVSIIYQVRCRYSRDANLEENYCPPLSNYNYC